MPVRDTVARIVELGLAGMLRERGFDKHGFVWTRRREGTLQFIALQLSHGNVGEVGRFYVNVALSFDALSKLAADAGSSSVTPEHHHDRRLEHWIPEAPSSWSIEPATPIEETGRSLADLVARVVSLLDRIESPRSMLEEVPLTAGAELVLRARLHYVEGDDERAMHALRGAAEAFSDRKGMSVADLIARHHLVGLG